MNYKNPFKTIKTYLEYGHNVQIKCKFKKQEIVLPLVIYYNACDKTLITEFGEQYNHRTFKVYKILSITPIPRKYQELKAGDIVDVLDLEEVDKEIRGKKSLQFIGNNSDRNNLKFGVTVLNNDIYYLIPIYAIAPHIEEKEKEEIKRCDDCYINDYLLCMHDKPINPLTVKQITKLHKHKLNK